MVVVHDLFFDHILPSAPSYYFIILLPVIGGLIVGPVICCLAPEARGDGIPTVMEALQRRVSQIRKRVGFIIICASAVTVGSCGSAGREGPIVQIGSSFGSLIGQAARLGPREINPIGRLPVVRENGSKELVGIITRSDAIQVYEKEAEQ
jgi:CIC family chloride channel protein